MISLIVTVNSEITGNRGRGESDNEVSFTSTRKFYKKETVHRGTI